MQHIQYLHLPITTIILHFLLLLSTTTTAGSSSSSRRLLHQPYIFPVQDPQGAQPPTTIAQPPSSISPSPSTHLPKYPFSTSTPTSTLVPSPTTTVDSPFFPFFPSPPPPPTTATTTTTATTFPANISSLVLPSSHSKSSHKSLKLISLIISLSLFSVLLFASLVFLLLRHRHHRQVLKSSSADSLRLFPPNATPSDTTTIDNNKKPPPPLFPCSTTQTTSSEFLYLGTLVSSRDPPANDHHHVTTTTTINDTKDPPPAASLNYQRLGSPELHPLPPLPRHHSHQNTAHDTTTTHGLISPTPSGEEENYNNEDEEEEEEEEFFSPRGSTGGNNNNASPYRSSRYSSPPLNGGLKHEFKKSRSLSSFNSNSSPYSPENSINSNSPSVVVFNSTSPLSIQSKSPDSLLGFTAPLPRFIPPPPVREPRPFVPFSPSSTDGGATTDCSPRASDFSGAGNVRPPTPPPLPPRLWEAGPPELVAPSRKVVVSGEKGSLGYSSARSKSEEMLMKPKLKPLHWDKVRASSDRAMVWDQLKSSSFQLNEEMIETLFKVNAKDGVRRQMPETNQENVVLDPKKSQNIAILLRALNVTVDEVCEALIEGNTDALGTELLESLLKMAPTKEEERKLKEYKDDSPSKLGTAETFLKAVLDIPFAFKRVDAMLYIANFDSEVDHLKRSFETLESACEELKSSRMFLKLLEAVLKTGNRMNVGTNRGDAHAFKLDTLLKLVDVKGKDGKTTLLHFVVQEIIRAEGARLSGVDPNPEPEKSPHSSLRDEIEFKKLGLQVVSRLSGELTNVKKAAAMDSYVLSNDVAKLVSGVSKITEVMKLNEDLELKDENKMFLENMIEFLKRAKTEMIDIQAKEGLALSMVKGLTEYFHGDSGKEEAHPLRIFMVVRDFLGILDQVCKDVGKINERKRVNSGQQIQVPVVPQVFHEGEKCSSSDDDDDESPSFSSS